MVRNHLRGEGLGRLIRPLSRELAQLDFEHVANCGFFHEIGRCGLTPRAELTRDFPQLTARAREPRIARTWR